MATKRGRKPAKKVKTLRSKGLSVSMKQMKGVKGGVIAIISPQKPTAGELLPYIEQDNLYKR